MKDLRKKGTIIMEDTRKIFAFDLVDGRRAETKADSKEEAYEKVVACIGKKMMKRAA